MGAKIGTPNLGAREATMFHPGYGLIPEKAPWTRIDGDSERFLKVFFVLRTIRKLVKEGCLLCFFVGREVSRSLFCERNMRVFFRAYLNV